MWMGLIYPLKEETFQFDSQSKNQSYAAGNRPQRAKWLRKAKNKRRDKDVQGKWNNKKSGVVFLISDKAEFKPETLNVTKKGAFWH